MTSTSGRKGGSEAVRRGVLLGLSRGRAAALAGVILAALGCRASGPPEPGRSTAIESPVTGAPLARSAREPGVPAEFQPALNALRAAIADRDDGLAEQILVGLRARSPADEEVLKIMAGCERILEGRELVGALELSLTIENLDPTAEGVPRFRLLVEGRHELEDPVVLSLPPGHLERLVVSVDASGFQAREYDTHTVGVFEEWELPAGQATRLEVLVDELPLGTSLAVREQWALRLRSGTIRTGGRELPAMRVLVDGCERTCIAGFLPTEFVPPEVLAEYVVRDEVNTPALMERAVRIQTSRHDEALELLLPVVEELERERPERLREIAPALRWLSRVGDPVRSWPVYLRRRAAGVGADEGGLRTLEIPVHRSRRTGDR